jgi:hypothetical protein
MAQLNDFSKIMHNGNEIGKVLHQGKTIWQASDLIAGNMEAGFYGEVPASEFVTGNALATAIGLTAGTAINSTQPWLKFALNGKTLYVAKKHFRHKISWDNINAVGAVYGTKTVAIGGQTYKVRLLKTSLIDPMSDPFDWAEVIGSEWNKLMHPIHVKAGTQSWSRNQGVDPDVVNWGINYTDVDLETNVYASYCQEKIGTSNVISRGFPGVDHDASSGGSGPPAITSKQGWRPCLELVKP